jgi:DNA (cytosine-5)-methyltransferase 1
MLKLLDLFSGIGGFSLGLESTGGFETIAFVEKDDFCQKVLKKHWPNTTIEGDIRNVKGDKYEADIITGGFPCQPFSVAGKRKGTDDDRYLWDETIRVVRECKPRWFIGENVEGLININNGVVLRQVQTDLEKEGFEVQCLVIPASGIGAWHQRKRIWIMAYSNSNGHRNTFTRSNGEKKRIQDQYRQNNSASWKFSRTSNVWETNKEHVSNSNSERLEGHRNKQQLQKNGREKHSIGNSNDETKESWWQTQSRICGVPNGVSFELDKGRNNRIKSLGNSIVPQIVRELGFAILEAEK